MPHADGLTSAPAGETPGAIPPRALEEAAEWLVRLNAPDASADDHAACERWRRRSPQHARAWERAERLLRTLGQLPPALTMPALDRPRSEGRRAAAKLAMLLAAGPSAWAACQAWRWADGPQGPHLLADHRTGRGERREVPLADGSVVTLNTSSAIDLRFDDAQRLIELRAGEILVQSHPDPLQRRGQPPRPLRVRTAQGLLQALGTRFSVRQDSQATQVAVLEGAVRVAPGARAEGAAADRVLQAGQQARFTALGVGQPAPVDESIAAWRLGMLLADRMPLAELAAELARYRGGWVHCDPAIADLRVSGAYPVGSAAETERALAMLVATYPIEAHQRLLGRWVTFVPR
ncbi:MAG TPA: FecR family protein [Ideonella sp.]|nr:FecR family protein [Ideonella sp.]